MTVDTRSKEQCLEEVRGMYPNGSKIFITVRKYSAYKSWITPLLPVIEHGKVAYMLHPTWTIATALGYTPVSVNGVDAIKVPDPHTFVSNLAHELYGRAVGKLTLEIV